MNAKYFGRSFNYNNSLIRFTEQKYQFKSKKANIPFTLLNI